MNAFIDRLRGLVDRLLRIYAARVVFARVDADVGTLVIGPDVCRRFHLVHAQLLSVGAGTVINGDCYINAQGGIRMGRYCHIAKGLTVLSSNHNFRSPISIPYDDKDVLKPVTVGDAVWIGANVCILPGTTVGDGAILSMGAVVRGAVPPCAIMAGNPASIVGWRDQDTFEKLKRDGAFV